MKLRSLLPLLCLLIIGACDMTKKTQVTKPGLPDIQKPRLTVMLVVDQMRYDYLTRFESLYTGGLKRLLTDGAVMTNAHYQHAITGTALGHATISTGCHPSHHGIVGNNFYKQSDGTTVYSATDTTVHLMGVDTDKKLTASSPRNLLVPGLGDWLKAANKKSKVYSVAFKDRSATMMGGQHPDRAFWFDRYSTRFITSDYYPGDYPSWAGDFLGKNVMKPSIERGWYRMLKEEEYSASREDDFPQELGTQQTTFPHTMGTFMPPASNASYEARQGLFLFASPMGDAFMLEFAKRLIEAEKLGMNDQEDLLFLSCSVADILGHQYGPYSQEMQDYYLRLDQYLNNFFIYLDERIGKDNYYVALSADHGVLPFPEELARRGIDAQRILTTEFAIQMDTVNARLQRELGFGKGIIKVANYQGVALNYEEATKKGMSAADLRKKVANALDTLYFVADTYTPEEILSPTNNKPFISFFRNNYHPDRGVEIKLRFPEYYLPNTRSNGTSHGSVYDYDTHVPMIFMGPQVTPGEYSQPVGIVDIAPTLARILNLSIPGTIDGRPIDNIFRPMPVKEKE